MCSLNPGRAPSYGLSCFWEKCESPRVVQRRLVWVWAEGIPGIPSPSLSSTASSQGTAELELGHSSGGPTLAPCPATVTAADVPPVPGALRGSWENASATLHL